MRVAAHPPHRSERAEFPFGAKMAGELSNAAIAPAIANAIARAAGARITELPLTAERVYRRLTENV